MNQIPALETLEKQFLKNSWQAKRLIRMGTVFLVVAFVALIFYSFRFENQSNIVKQEIQASATERQELKQIIVRQDRTIRQQAAAIKEQNFMLSLKDSIINEQRKVIIELKDDIQVLTNRLLNANSEGIELNQRFSPGAERN